jgi:hypothetical protein
MQCNLVRLAQAGQPVRENLKKRLATLQVFTPCRFCREHIMRAQSDSDPKHPGRLEGLLAAKVQN